MTLRIGFVTCHFPPDSIGGGQVQSMRLCEALSKKYEVTVFARAYKKGLPVVEDTGNYIINRRRASKIPVLRSLIDLVKVLNQIRTYKKEIGVYISFHIQLAALMVVFARRLYGKKAIVSPRGFEDFDFKWYKRAFQKYIYSRADIILIQSEKIKESFCSQLEKHCSLHKQKAIIDKIGIFPNGVTVPENLPSKLSGRPGNIIFIGRLEPVKGVSTLLEAFKSCNQKIHLKIIGDGSQRNYLESLAKGLNVSFLGMAGADEVKFHLQNSKALILPSLTENFPNVILEAFCEGVPVIASDVGGISELVEDGVNGYLVPPGSSDAISQKIAVLLSNGDKLDKMGMNAYQKVRSYNWNFLVDQFHSFLVN